jgi:hypothetical protein
MAKTFGVIMSNLPVDVIMRLFVWSREYAGPLPLRRGQSQFANPARSPQFSIVG